MSGPLVIPGVPVSERRHSQVLQSALASPRLGVMLHYDDSSRDDWAVEWFSDPRCTNGYTWLALDSGRVVELADPALRTPHAGSCSVPNANSRFYGVSAATSGLVVCTDAQRTAIVATCTALFRFHSWPAYQVGDRIVGHDALAVWNPATTRAAGMPDVRGRALWGKVGRKVDPTGVRRDRLAVLDVNDIRAAVVAELNKWQSITIGE